MAPIVSVQIFVGEHQSLPATQTGGRRDDVANAYPAYPDAVLSGFSCIRQLDPSLAAPDSVRVQAVSANAFAVEIVVPVDRTAARPPAAPPMPRPQAPPVPQRQVPQSPVPQAPVTQAPVTQRQAPQAQAPQPFAPFRQRPNYKLTASFNIAPDPPPTSAKPALAAPDAAPWQFETRLPASAPGTNVVRLQPASDPRREIFYFCDALFLAADGTLGVDGWAVCAAGIAAVSIYLDRDKVGDAELGLARPDVAEQYSAIPTAAQAGFRFRQQLPDVAPGEHTIRIVVRNSRDDVRDEIKRVTMRAQGAAASARAEAARPPARTPAKSEFRFELDKPHLLNDAVQEPVTSRLTIEGWALARSGVTGVEVFLDDQRLGDAHYGLARQDVGAAFPDWENALRSGYAFHCPPRSLRDGSHTVRLVARAKSGQELERSFTINVKKDDTEGLANIRRRISRAEANVLAAVLDDLDYRPEFRLVLRQTGTAAPEQLRPTIESLTRQSYPGWRLAVLTDAAGEVDALRALVGECAGGHADRVSVVGPADPEFDADFDPAFDAAFGALPGDDATAGAAPGDDAKAGAALANAAPGDAALANAALVGVLCPGDELAVDALAEFAIAGGLYRAADLLYADEACVSPASHEREPFFKPDFSPDLLLSTNYIGRPWFASAALLHRTGVTPRALLRDGEYDLVLRCAEQAASVHHIPRLLAPRGAVAPDDDAMGRAALAAAAARRGIAAEVMDGCLPGTWRLRRLPRATGKVAIIIPTCAAHGYIETCIESLRARTAYKNYEIVCIDNIPSSQMSWQVWLQQNADQIVAIREQFNWSRFNNLAAAVTESDYLLFLNDDIEITRDDWLDVLLEHAQRPEVGIVGPQLLYPSGKVQHAGMFLGNGIGRHAFRFAAADEPGYFGFALTQRNVIAVTGACMLMRREVFQQLGGFDEAHSVINNDLDFCLRAHEAGKLTVFTPHASLVHHELASREHLPDVFDTAVFTSRWKTLFAAGDPYFSPLLSRYSDDYRADEEPVRPVFAAHPLFEPDEIRRILVVKLDHIGDFVTALPAIRRLKAVFPLASVTVLAGRHARGFAKMEPAIDALIEFDFFHARSQLGEKTLSKDDFLALRAQLAPYRFDLAVDLRKHLSTRDVLRYTGARYLAGYDYMGQFPFLDIALEWEGDKSLQRKRSHIVDDLLGLVEAIATACGTDRRLLPVAPARPDMASLPAAVRALFAKPVVAMHIGAGNITKTWPAEYYSALIDLLTERNGVNVLLIGGADERDAADALRQTLLRPDAVGSLVGETLLDALPALLSICCLYIGNDSGPKHIAAGLGIATIGIHSGVVDAIEWGPVGRRTVALRRDMACSPCYLARAEDCPRALACLRQLEPSVVHQTATMLLARPVVWAGPVAGANTTGASDATVPKQLPAMVANQPGGANRPAANQSGVKSPGAKSLAAQSPLPKSPLPKSPGAGSGPAAKPRGRGQRVRA
jgi:ADP-heptose:LPS heptosyltransferase/GT2 family glycosyltransferase